MTVSAFAQSRFVHRDMSGINITPLVDVMLVLLIIFMVQAIPSAQSLEMALSHVAPPLTTVPPPRTLVSIGTDGRIRMEGASIAPADLRGEFVALKSRAPNTTLALETSEGADYGLFARVLAEARNAGFADVALRP
jgi:biopolymer transport protein ExbD